VYTFRTESQQESATARTMVHSLPNNATTTSRSAPFTRIPSRWGTHATQKSTHSRSAQNSVSPDTSNWFTSTERNLNTIYRIACQPHAQKQRTQKAKSFEGTPAKIQGEGVNQTVSPRDKHAPHPLLSRGVDRCAKYGCSRLRSSLAFFLVLCDREPQRIVAGIIRL